jgi:hypothetical protein
MSNKPPRRLSRRQTASFGLSRSALCGCNGAMSDISVTHTPKPTLCGRRRHPSHASPLMNASDIRIVFDPTLLEEPEDLD